MIRINIFTESAPRTEFLHQIDRKRFPESEYYIRENSAEDIDWDLVVVYEGVHQPFSVRCKEGNMIFFSGEPPMSRIYPKAFLAQFDTLITQHPHLKHPDNRQNQPCMNWHLSYSFKKKEYLKGYADYKDQPPIPKTKDLSLITSSKRLMPGHNLRLKFVEVLRQKLGSKIELFGRGFHFVDAKTEAINDFRFTISMENSRIPHYWTEKFADPILAFTIPFYCGCTNIDDYFPEDCYIPIDIDNKDQAIARIREVLLHPEEEYAKRLPALLKARKKILDEYNLFAELDSMFGKQMKEDRKVREYNVRPSNSFPSFKYLHYKLRFTRLLARLYITYLK